MNDDVAENIRNERHADAKPTSKWDARDENGKEVTVDRSTKSWERARSINVSIAQFETFDTHYAVQVGDGSAHAVIYDEGNGKAWCDCKGHEHNDRCAHVYAVHRRIHDDDAHEDNNHGLTDFGVTTE